MWKVVFHRHCYAKWTYGEKTWFLADLAGEDENRARCACDARRVVHEVPCQPWLGVTRRDTEVGCLTAAARHMPAMAVGDGFRGISLSAKSCLCIGV